MQHTSSSEPRDVPDYCSVGGKILMKQGRKSAVVLKSTYYCQINCVQGLLLLMLHAQNSTQQMKTTNLVTRCEQPVSGLHTHTSVHSFQYTVLRQVHSLFQSEFSTVQSSASALYFHYPRNVIQ